MNPIPEQPKPSDIVLSIRPSHLCDRDLRRLVEVGRLLDSPIGSWLQTEAQFRLQQRSGEIDFGHVLDEFHLPNDVSRKSLKSDLQSLAAAVKFLKDETPLVSDIIFELLAVSLSHAVERIGDTRKRRQNRTVVRK